MFKFGKTWWDPTMIGCGITLSRSSTPVSTRYFYQCFLFVWSSEFLRLIMILIIRMLTIDHGFDHQNSNGWSWFWFQNVNNWSWFWSSECHRLIIDQVINKTGMVSSSAEGFQRVLDNTEVIIIIIISMFIIIMIMLEQWACVPRVSHTVRDPVCDPL